MVIEHDKDQDGGFEVIHDCALNQDDENTSDLSDNDAVQTEQGDLKSKAKKKKKKRKSGKKKVYTYAIVTQFLMTSYRSDYLFCVRYHQKHHLLQ
jgi:hypothetical protein